MTMPAPARRAPRLLGLGALISAALEPMALDFSGMPWPSDRDETWM